MIVLPIPNKIISPRSGFYLVLHALLILPITSCLFIIQSHSTQTGLYPSAWNAASQISMSHHMRAHRWWWQRKEPSGAMQSQFCGIPYNNMSGIECLTPLSLNFASLGCGCNFVSIIARRPSINSRKSVCAYGSWLKEQEWRREHNCRAHLQWSTFVLPTFSVPPATSPDAHTYMCARSAPLLHWLHKIHFIEDATVWARQLLVKETLNDCMMCCICSISPYHC